MESLLLKAVIYLASAVVMVPVAKRLGLGSVLGYLLAGVLIGPIALGLVGQEGQDVMHFAEFGVVLMLFVIGLELQPSLLWRMRGPIFGMGGLQVLFTSLALGLVGILAGLAWQTSLAIGMTLALSSTAIVLQTLAEKGLMKTDGGQSSFSVLLFQDIAVIPMLAVFPMLALEGAAKVTGGHEAAAHGHSWLEGLPLWGQALLIPGIIGGIIIGGLYLLRPVFRLIASVRMREIFTATALLLVIGIAYLMTKINLSPALGAFVAGVVLAGSEYRHELESDIEPFKGLLLGLFFIAVGATIDFHLIAAKPVLIGGLAIGLIVLKFLILFGIGKIFKMGLDSGALFAFGLAQGGEFGFVLFSYAGQNGVIPPDVIAPLVAVIAITMALTPLVMLINEKFIQPNIGVTETAERKPDVMDEENQVIIAGFGRFGNIVGRLLRANQIGATFLDTNPDNVEILRKLGIKVFYGESSRADLLHAAGAHKAKILVLAQDSHEKMLGVVHLCKQHFPNLKIMARTYGRIEAYELLDAGVEYVYRETFDSSLRMGVDVLTNLGVHPRHAQRMSQKFRKRDEHDLRELANIRHDKKGYLSSARERIEELERVFTAELDGHDETRDMGWDTETLRKDFADK